MKIWILVVFSFNMQHMTLSTEEFHTQAACEAAAAIVQKPITSIADTPVGRTTNAGCVQDIKPQKAH